MNSIEEILLKLGISNEEFLEYIKQRTKVLDNIDMSWYGVFPIVDAKGILQDMRTLVPSAQTEFMMLINVHEYNHAYELYNELGNKYVDDKETREIRARIKEEEEDYKKII